jgi:hypothetical protein
MPLEKRPLFLQPLYQFWSESTRSADWIEEIKAKLTGLITRVGGNIRKIQGQQHIWERLCWKGNFGVVSSADQPVRVEIIDTRVQMIELQGQEVAASIGLKRCESRK